MAILELFGLEWPCIVVRCAAGALKIGVHSPFNSSSTVGFGTFCPKNFGQAYYTGFPLLCLQNDHLWDELIFQS